LRNPNITPTASSGWLEARREGRCVADSAFLSRPHEPQVFVDASGRRAVAVGRLVRLAALVFAAWMAALVVGASGFGGLPAPVRIAPRVLHTALPVHERDTPAEERAGTS
jgi:hypothetical protein